MKALHKYLWLPLFAVGLTACGGDDDDPIFEPEPETTTTIVDAAREAGNFTTLLGLLEDADLAGALDDEDATYTVFAPTDAAFAALSQETLDSLQGDALQDALLYHVVEDVAADEAAARSMAGTTLGMMNGDDAALSLSGDDLYINLSLVTTTDIMTDNGVIHVIDAVLLPPAEKGEPTETIAQIAAASDDFDTLEAALTQANLVDTLNNPEGTFTVFAPTDAAFDMIGSAQLEGILADNAALTSILEQHVVSGTEANSITAFTLNGSTVETAGGADISVEIIDGELFVGGARVVTTDIYASNGVIHVIESVIVGDVELPAPIQSITEVAQGDERFSTLVSLLGQTGLDMTLDDLETDFTVFAPTNAAIDALGELNLTNEQIENILLYHVVQGSVIDSTAAVNAAGTQIGMANMEMAAVSYVNEELHINTSLVTDPNIMATNGVIHAIDKVMMPPEYTDATGSTIAEVAAGDGDFSTLVSLLSQVGLDATLNDANGSFTVFAPTNAAFDAIPAETLEAIQNSPETLTAILEQHVVVDTEADSLAAYTLNGTNLTTASGAQIPVSIAGGELMIGGATVTTANIQASNGIIHVIDAVIVGDVEIPSGGSAISIPIEDGLSGWSTDGRPNTLSFNAGELVITPDWSQDTNIAMYTSDTTLEVDGKTLTVVVDIPADYVGTGIDFQIYVQQNSGSYSGVFASEGYLDDTNISSGGEYTISMPISNPPADIQRVAMQILGSERTADITANVVVKSMTIE